MVNLYLQHIHVYDKLYICNLPQFRTGFGNGNELLQLSNTLDFEGTKHRESVL